MSSTDEGPAAATLATPRWVAWTLVVGSLLLVVSAWFVSGFLSEPSATGRVRLVLLGWVAFSGCAALLGIAAATAAVRGVRWSRPLALVAAAAMTVTGAGALAGVPALLGLFWSRASAST